MIKRITGAIIGVFGLLVISIVGFQFFVKLYPEFLWFDSLGYSSVFSTMFFTKFIMFGVFSLVMFLFFALNYFIAKSLLKNIDGIDTLLSDSFARLFSGNTAYSSPIADKTKEFISKSVNLFMHLGFAIVSMLFGGAQGFAQWEKVLQFFNQVPSQYVDPIFSKNISFYFFSLPFYKMISGYLMFVLIFIFAILFIVYAQLGLLKLKGVSVFKKRSVKAHLLLIASGFFVVLGLNIWLMRYSVLFSSNNLFFGAGYIDINARLLNFSILAVISFFVAVILLFDIFVTHIKPVIGAVFAMLICGIVLGGIYPEFLDNFVVKPNQYEKQKPYIEHNLLATRQAYGLDKVSEKFYDTGNKLTIDTVHDNPEIIDNIRLWDEGPLLKTFAQLQEIRTYYEFKSADVDRYYDPATGKNIQVILSARELIGSQLSDKAQNWVNRKLQYTHGYGVVLSPVNKVTPEGMPELYVKNIPPVSEGVFKVDRPEIYYGEGTDDYVVVNTKLDEFDYPKGDDNKYTKYQGKGGVAVGSLWRRLLYSIYFNDKNILFTKYISKDSKVAYNRTIAERVKKLAPFIVYDTNPYLVISNGRLYWMIDAYTVSGRFPYSQPFKNRFNYIRNSIKVVIGAYDGDVNYYIVDKTDPIAGTYTKIYPELFKEFSEMPDDLKKHIRYPIDYFAVQSSMYRLYHMNNSQVFYNQEDVWEIPKEQYEENEIYVDPYYVNMKLPEEKKASFLLMQPFTPSKKGNLVSWLIAKNDPEDYGELSVYKLSKEKQIFGPMQMESRIDQDTEISKQLTLWGQKGSKVIRGNLLIIPIDNALLYVEPIYLQATASKLPQLKQVVVSYGSKVVMNESLESGIREIFGFSQKQSKKSLESHIKESVSKYASKEDIKKYIKKAIELYDSAEKHLKQADWSSYGNKLKELRELLNSLIN